LIVAGEISGVTRPAMVQAFKNFAEKHPESWGMEAVTGVAMALRTTWLCR